MALAKDVAEWSGHCVPEDVETDRTVDLGSSSGQELQPCQCAVTEVETLSFHRTTIMTTVEQKPKMGSRMDARFTLRHQAFDHVPFCLQTGSKPRGSMPAKLPPTKSWTVAHTKPSQFSLSSPHTTLGPNAWTAYVPRTLLPST